MLANRAASTSASESKPAELLRYKVCAVFEITRNPACLIQQKQQPRLFLRRRETHCTHAAAQVPYLSSVSSERYFRFWRAALQLTCSGTNFAPVDHWLCCFGCQLWLLQIVNREFRSLLVGYHNSLYHPFVAEVGGCLHAVRKGRSQSGLCTSHVCCVVATSSKERYAYSWEHACQVCMRARHVHLGTCDLLFYCNSLFHRLVA